MRWEGGRRSENLEDRRGMRRPGVAIGGIGVLLVLVLGLVFGVDPQQLLQIAAGPGGGAGAGGQAVERELTPEEIRSRDFASTILAFTEDVWTEQFRRAGERYVPPKMVLFAEAVETGCGTAPSAVGPFYCPVDRTVYLDPTFFVELERGLGGSRGEFSQAYVIAHEIGHHVQNLLGYTRLVDEKRRTLPPEEFNRWSVRLELQADYLAGVWAHYGQERFAFIEPGDVESAIKSARAIGDDRIQKNSRGFTSPESYTHGTSEQRTRWFLEGLKTGELSTLKQLFELPYEEL
ncbi:MAG: neutral zinc metallopeptidase [Pirellulales bacterium]|nr:neutral zinc metallopeptidase [Pirellulales bacterium]